MAKYFSRAEKESAVIIKLEVGEIGLSQREELKKELAEMLRGSRLEFVFDLSEVDFMSSLLIATLVFFAKEARLKGGDVRLTGLTGKVKEVAEITQLGKIIEIYSSEKEAIQSFKK